MGQPARFRSGRRGAGAFVIVEIADLIDVLKTATSVVAEQGAGAGHVVDSIVHKESVVHGKDVADHILRVVLIGNHRILKVGAYVAVLRVHHQSRAVHAVDIAVLNDAVV